MNNIETIENLIKENKELKNKCNELNFKYTAQWVDDNFIPKSKVKEKIEEIQQTYDSYSEIINGEKVIKMKYFCEAVELAHKQDVLEELLEKGE
jgi:predicted translin family RNA/ssDNA-binding protein